ncbi:hypothetical protein [Leucobacter sp. NPDC077196]|uniref:hypothetical protein n=1 Tax=Leucobacter sp. NPDC077196 TaxID=3154959 RepID=UPI003424E209
MIGSWIGEGAPDDTGLVLKWVEKAEREVRRKVPDLQARIDAEADEGDTDLLQATVDVVVAMVTRKFRNPESIRQTNVTTGPYTTSKTYGGDLPGDMAMTDDELAKLQGQSGGAYSISMIPSHSPFAVWPL